MQPTGGGVRNEEENEDVSGANIRIPFILKRCEFFNHLYQFTNFNIVSYWKFEAKQAKKRAKRASELRLLQLFHYLKRREGGPKGRPSEASLNFFLESWLI